MSDDYEKGSKSQREFQEALADKLGYKPHVELVRTLRSMFLLPSTARGKATTRAGSQASDRQSALWGMRTGTGDTSGDRIKEWLLHGSLERNPMNPVLMLTRNALELTKQAVESVLAQNISVSLYIIENDSTDGTKEWLKEQTNYANAFRDMRYWRMTPAKGVSASWNFGLGYFFDTAGCDHVLVLNNDLVLRPDFYEALLQDGGDFVTGVGVNDRAQMEQPFVSMRRNHPDFSAFLIRRKVWQTVGSFDESMILYASDNDFHVRCQKAGIRCYTIGIPFYHVASGTLKYATDAERKAIQDQADRDRDTFVRKYGFEVGSPMYERQFREVDQGNLQLEK